MAAATVTGKPQPRSDRRLWQGTMSTQTGFTLMEILVVVMLISVLAAVAVPVVSNSVEKARESALKENLLVMRRSLDDYLADNGRYPENLALLVEKRYLRYIPEDPVLDDPEPRWRARYTEYADGSRGIYDVRSTSDASASDGSSYEDW